jgi:nitroreductase
MFMQTLMIAAVDAGLATCPQAALAEYPDIVRAELGLTGCHIVCGMALGYEDTHHPVNQYRTPRLSLDQFARWLE